MQRKTNEDNTQAIDTEKKQYDGNLQTSSSSKKVDNNQPTKILTRKAQQATNVPPFAEIEIKENPDERTTIRRQRLLNKQPTTTDA